MRSRLLAQLAQLGLRGVGLVTSIIVVMVLARQLGPANYGVLAAGLTLSTLIYGLCDAGIYPLGVRRIAMGAAAYPTASAMVGGRLAILAVLLPITGAAILLWGGDSRVVMLICVAASLPYAVTAFRAVPEAQLRPVTVGFILVSQNAAWLAFVVAGTWMNASVVVLAWYSVAAVLVQASLALVVAIKARQPSRDFATRVTIGAILREASPLMISSLTVTLYYRGGQLIVWGSATAEEGASFLAAFRLLDAAQIFPATVVSVALPLIAVVLAQREDPRRIYLRYAVGSTLIAAAVSATTSATAGWLSRALLGPDYPSAAGYISILFWAFPFITLAYVTSSALIASGSRRVVATLSATVSLAGLAGVWFASQIDPTAVALTVVMVEVVHAGALAISLAVVASRSWGGGRAPSRIRG